MRLSREAWLVGFFLAIVNLGVLHAQTYFVSPQGNDIDPGSLLKPWKTLMKANRSLQAGDTLFIRQGTYAEDINPVHSGTEGRPIVYTRFGNEEVILQGAGKGEDAVVAIGYPGSAAGWGNVSDIVVEGIHIHPVNSSYGVALYGRESKRNVIRNCRLMNSRLTPPRDHAILIGGTENTVIEGNVIQGEWDLGIITTARPRKTVIRNNVIRNCLGSLIDIQTSYGENQGMLIENNLLSGSRVEDGIQFEPDYSRYDPGLRAGVIIRNNTICGNAENAIDLKGAACVLIEGNLIYGNRGDNDATGNLGGGAGGIMKGDITNTQAHHIIIRRNVLYDNFGGIYITHHDWMVVHNTVVGNNRSYLGPDIPVETIENAPGDHCRRRPGLTGIMLMETAVEGFRGCIIKNNIVGGHHQGEMAVRTTADLTRTEIDGNCYFNADTVLLADLRTNWNWKKIGFHSLRERFFEIASPGLERRSLIAERILQLTGDSPVGPGPFDFTLVDGSPALDAGVPLTHTRSAGSGTVMPVDNAAVFCDGFGIVPGDTVQIASNGLIAQVLETDTARQNLLLSKPVSWAKGDGISLPYEGAAPDIGAFERKPAAFHSESDASVTGFTVLRANRADTVRTIRASVWYDLVVQFEAARGWRDIAFADIWLSDAMTGSGTIENRGGPFNPEQNYVFSCSILENTLWVKENERLDRWTLVSGRLSRYIDDDGGEYRQDSTLQVARVRFKLLEEAEPGLWILNGYVKRTDGSVSSLHQERVTVAPPYSTTLKANVSIAPHLNAINKSVEIVLTTSHDVEAVPSPLLMQESDGSVTEIPLSGLVPGSVFRGRLILSPTIAEGMALFHLGSNALVDENGNSGQTIQDGAQFYIDREPPASPTHVSAGR